MVDEIFLLKDLNTTDIKKLCLYMLIENFEYDLSKKHEFFTKEVGIENIQEEYVKVKDSLQENTHP